MPRTQPPCASDVTPCQAANEADAHGEDHALARAALAGDASARKLLARRLECVDRMLAARNRRGGQVLDAEDLLDVGQDVRATVWRRLDEYRPVAALSSWIYGVCEFQLRNATRRVLRQPKLLDVASLELPDPAEDNGGYFDELHHCMGRLALKDERLVRWKHFEGLTLAEIAARLDWNLNRVKSRYARSLHSLRSCLESKTSGERGSSPGAERASSGEPQGAQRPKPPGNSRATTMDHDPNPSLTPAQQNLLDEVLCGDRSTEDPAVVEAVGSSASFARELRALHGVQSTLDQAATMEQAVQRDVELMAQTSTQRRRTWWAAALVLVGLSVAFVAWKPWASPSQPPGTRFLGGEVRVLPPTENQPGFVFQFSLPPRGMFRVRVFDEAQSPVMAPDELTQPTWNPDMEAWPPVVEIEVEALNRQGDSIGVGRLRFQR